MREKKNMLNQKCRMGPRKCFHPCPPDGEKCELRIFGHGGEGGEGGGRGGREDGIIMCHSESGIV